MKMVRFGKKFHLVTKKSVFALLLLVMILSMTLWLIVGWYNGRSYKRVLSDTCNSKNVVRQQQCWRVEIETAVKNDGVDSAFTLLASIYEHNPSFRQICHVVTHKIGEDSYMLFHQGNNFKVSTKAAYCSYGFYHGFMEALLAAHAPLSEAQSFCKYIDKQMKELTPDASLQCFHGIGHGVVNPHDLKAVKDESVLINPALLLCAKVSVNKGQLSRCATGVFNGLSFFYTDGEYGLKVDPSDPLKVCRAQNPQFQEECYLSMNHMLLELTHRNFQAAAFFIEQIPEDKYAQYAIRNLAAPIAVENYEMKDHVPAIQMCRALQSRLRMACIEGYAYGFLEHGSPENEYRKALEFCGNSGLSNDEASSCFRETMRSVKLWYAPAKVVIICDFMKTKYNRTCEI